MRLIQIALISAAFSVGSAATGSSSDSKTKFESKWTPEDYLVKGLDKYGSTDTMYSGYMPVDMKNNSRGSLFFWLVMKRNSEKTVSKGDKVS